jgi:cytochrome c-type biogenesis protein CcmE
MKFRKRYLVGVVVILLAAAYLVFLSFNSAVSYYVTVSEFYESGSEFYDTGIRIAGEIDDMPIDWDPEKVELDFFITEGGKTMEVLYNGARPSSFEPGKGILVEGKYDPNGFFRATQIILKCPSKYESEE